MSKVKYHVNPETGKTGQCSATVKGCQFAKDGEIPEHYDNEDDARKAYEKQNEENTFGNTISKNVNVNELNSKVVAESLKNVNPNAYFNVVNDAMREDNENIPSKAIMDYTQNLYSDDVEETVNNINAEYDRLKDLPKKNKDEIIKDIDTIDSAKEYSLRDQFYYENYAGKINDKNQLVVTAVVDEHSEPEEPGLNRKLVKSKKVPDIVYDSDDDYEDAYDYYEYIDENDFDGEYDYTDAEENIGTNVNVGIYIYDLTDDEKAALKNHEQYAVVRQQKRIIDNNSVPNWAVYPVQDNVEKRAAYNINLMVGFAELKMNKAARELNKAKQNKKPAKQLETDYKNLRKNWEDEKKKLVDNNKLMFEDDLAARYPSSDPVKRRKAAQQWIKDNEKALPDFNKYNGERKDIFGYYSTLPLATIR